MELADDSVRPIGVVRSSLRDPRDAPNQAFEGAPEARLEIDPAYVDALHRLTPETAIDGPTLLRVRELEAIDGTPILDLKTVLEQSRDE